MGQKTYVEEKLQKLRGQACTADKRLIAFDNGCQILLIL